VPASPQPAPAAPGAYGASAAYQTPAVSPYPPPPNLHWGVCVLVSIVTCGIFSVVWIMVEAVWVKKIQPASKAVTYFGIVIGLWVLSFVLSISGTVSAARTGHQDSALQAIQGTITLGYCIVWIVG